MVYEKTLFEIAQNLRKGVLEVEELLNYCCHKYDLTEKYLCAYKSWKGGDAIEVAKIIDKLIKKGYDSGPLMGIPLSVKDIYSVNNFETFAGSRYKLNEAIWEKSGSLIEQFHTQLALIVGKTHTVEFAFGGLGLNSHWETPVNPWDLQSLRVPGGSSSGAGVSLVQQSALIALGTDTAGSVRVPASFTGTVGLKTTKGLWPTDGIVPLSSTLDTPGVLTKSVADSVYVFSTIKSKGTFESLKLIESRSPTEIVIGIPSNYFFDDVDNSIANCFEYVVKELANIGIKFKPVFIPMCDEVVQIFKSGGLGAPELLHFLKTNMPEKLDELGSIIQLRLKESYNLSAQEYLTRLDVLNKASQSINTIFDICDVFIHPTVGISPPKISDVLSEEPYKKENFRALHNSCIANLMNLCAISLPIGRDSLNMPIGLQITAGAFQEEKLLAVALAIEDFLGKPFQVLGVPNLNNI